MDIAPLGFAIDSAQALKAAKDLGVMNAAAEKSERQAARLERAMAGLGKHQFMKNAADGVADYSKQINTLESQFSGILGAQTQFDNKVNEINAALSKGVLTMDQANYAARQLGAANLEAAKSMNVYVGSMRTMGNIQGSVGNQFAQLNDIVVTAAGGMNPALIGMQQGMQMVQGFAGQSMPQALGSLGGAFMTLLNPMTLLTVGVVAGGAALVQWGISALGASEEARTLDDAMGDLDAASSGLKSTQDILKMSVDELKEKYGEFAFLVKDVASGLEQNQIAIMNNLLTEQIISSAEAFDMFAAKMDAATASAQYLAAEEAALNGTMLDGAVVLSGAVSQTEQSIRNMMDTLGVSRVVAIGLADDFARVRNASSMEDRIASFLAIDAALSAAGVSASKLPPSINKAMAEAKELSIKMAEAKTQTQALANSAPGAGWMGAAIGETNMLIGRLIAAKGAADALRSVETAGLAAQYKQYGEGRVAGESAVKESGTLYGGTGNVLSGTGWYDNSGGGSGGGGGGGGGSDPYADNLNRLVESLQTERETTDAWYNENLAILNDRRALEILGETAHKDALLDLEREYLERKSKLGEGYDQFTLGSADKLFGELYSLSGSGYEGLLRLQKSFGAAQALVNTYTAASQVLADPKLGFFAKFAAVAKTVAAGMGLVNAIKGGGGSGGGGGGSGAATAPSVSTASAAQPDRVTRIELMGEDWMVALVEPMIDQIYKATGNGRVIVARG